MAALKPLDQQVVVITGASSGIGLCTALLAAERGARLVLAARNAETLDAIAQQILEAGGEAVAVPTDVGDREQVYALADAAVACFGGIDTWINDAGVAIYGRLEEVCDDDSRRLFDTNFWGVVYGSLAALPHLSRAGGALINIGSEASEAMVPLQGMYSASKHAVKGFTDSLRIEVEEVDRLPVSVTLVQPTAVDTPYPEHARNYTEREPKLPLLMIDPHRVAAAILEAATRGGRYVNVGAMAHVDTATSRLLPGLDERIAALQVDRQQQDEPPPMPEGTLFQPGGEGHVYGQGHARQH